MIVRTGTALAALLMLASGCATAEPGSDGGAGGTPAGRVFLSTAVTEDGRPFPLEPGTRIRLSFGTDSELSVNAGCNSMGGRFRVDGGRLALPDLAMTDMGCLAGLQEQDRWVAGLLTSRPGWRLAGDTLTLTAGTKEITMTDREVADPDRPLVGTRWEVDTVLAGDAAASAPAGAYLVFTDEGRVQGSTGCNQMSGAAKRDGDRISFAQLITTKMACADELNRLEAAVISVLDGSVAWRVDADRLELRNPNGHGLSLRAA